MKIGVFDSGFGGLTVLARAVKYLPDGEFIYYADTDNVPYGTKTQDEIIGYSREAARFLLTHNVDGIVIACNTATSMAVDVLRDEIKTVPIIGMEPAVKPAIEWHRHEKILVCATPATIHGKKLHELIVKNADNDTIVDLVGLPGLVMRAENGIFDKANVEEYLRSVIKEYDYTACVLGCTHFAYFSDSIKDVLPNAELIDGTEGTVKQLCRLEGVLAEEHDGEIKADIKFYQSGRRITDESKISFCYSLMERAEKMRTI